MPAITEGKLTFTFPEGWQISKYDDWAHYREHFIKVCEGTKAMDIVALEPGACCWLLEVKDYREHRRTKTIDLADEVSEKVRDTVAGLVAAQFCANDADEKAFARKALRATGLRVVLHLEQPAKHSKLFPRAINPTNVRQRLKQLLKSIAPHPRVVEVAEMAGIPWTVTSGA
jgi:hypothetical protein